MKLCLLGVENGRNICKNKVINVDLKKLPDSFNLEKSYYS